MVTCAQEPVDQARVHEKQSAAVVLDDPAETVANLLRFRVHGAGRLAHADDRLRAVCFPEGGVGNQPIAAVDAAIEVQAQPWGQVAGAGVDGTGRVRFRLLIPRNDREAPVFSRPVPCGAIGTLFRLGRGQGNAGHSKRREQALAEEVAPRLASGPRRRVARGHVHDRLVLHLGAKRPRQGQSAHPANLLFLGPRRPVPQQVVRTDPRAVRDQVAEAHEGVGSRVGQMKVGQVLADRVVPRQFAVVGQGGNQRGGECLGARRQGEHGVCGHRFAIQLANAVTLQVN